MHRLALTSILVSVMVLGCHKSTTQRTYPKLAEGDSPDAKPAVANADPTGRGTTPATQLYEPGGAACMPPGVYDVAFDLSSAKLTVVGQDEVFCRSMLEAVPKNLLDQMKLEIENGQLGVYWPTKLVIASTSQCQFEIKSPPVRATITFAGGNGTGTGSYAVGSSNHPGEKCEATGVKLTLVRASS